jgi:hypothetical protein
MVPGRTEATREITVIETVTRLNREVAATIRLRINDHARLVVRTALEAVVAGKPIKQTFDDYRTGNKRWRQHIPGAADICDALFDPPSP